MLLPVRPSALIFWGGWEGHQPESVATFLASLLEGESFKVQLADTSKSLLELDRSDGIDLVVPVVTMGSIAPDELGAVTRAVAERGVGLAGCHGGMCDAYRAEPEWHFMTGGQWVAHPGDDGVRYSVEINRALDHEITRGMQDFEVVTEQYYLHVDPGVKVLASTRFPHPGAAGPHTSNPCAMPQVWTKMYGSGRVFYCALGHSREVLEAAEPRELMRRGMRWAARCDRQS